MSGRAAAAARGSRKVRNIPSSLFVLNQAHLYSLNVVIFTMSYSLNVIQGEGMYERKAYERLLDWKRSSAGETALLVEGARRVGKTTLVKRFAEREYSASLVIDFAHTSDDVRDTFRPH